MEFYGCFMFCDIVFNKNLELSVKKLSRDSRLELFGDKKKIFVSNDGIYFLWKLLQIHRDSTLDVFMLREQNWKEVIML